MDRNINFPSKIHLCLLIFLTMVHLNLTQPEDCRLSLTPSAINTTVGEFTEITINCSCCTERSDVEAALRSLSPEADVGEGIYVMRIMSVDRRVATPLKVNYRGAPSLAYTHCTETSYCAQILHELPTDIDHFFAESNQVGRTDFQVAIIWANTTKRAPTLQATFARKGLQLLKLSEVKLSAIIVRRLRIFYTVFDWSAAFIACMAALSVGCCTETAHLRTHYKSPLGLIAGITSQHVIMPLLTFGISAGLNLTPDLAFGLFATSVFPGGGLAHLIVFLMGGDRTLSTALSMTSAILNLATAPAWLIALGRYWNVSLKLYMVVLWILPVVVSHLFGVILRRIHPPAADAVMNWLTRPLLLLSGILLITLGVYINQYAFNYVNYDLVLGVMLTIFGGFCVGGLSGMILRQDKPRRKALAAETSVYNCLIVIPVLRHCLRQPDADLSATVPLWKIFFTPAPILLYFVFHKAKTWMMDFIEKRKEKQYRHYSTVSMLAKMTEEVAAVSAPIVMDDQANGNHRGTEEHRTTAL